MTTPPPPYTASRLSGPDIDWNRTSTEDRGRGHSGMGAVLSHEVFTTMANPWNPGPPWLAQEFLDNAGEVRRQG